MADPPANVVPQSGDRSLEPATSPGPDRSNEDRLLQVGQVVRPHGLRGEVVVDMLSNRPERTEPGSRLLAVVAAGGLAGPGVRPPDAATMPGPGSAGSTRGTGGGPQLSELTVRHARRLPSGGPGPGTRWVVQFDEVAGRQDAEAIRGVELWGSFIEDQGDLADQALWVHQLVGSTVVQSDGRELGAVVAIVDNPASDLMELAGGALIPLCFVVEHHQGRVVVDVPLGLVD